MLSIQKKIEKFTKNAMEDADILPSAPDKLGKRKSKKIRVPESLDQGEIKILQLMEKSADSDYYTNVLKELEQRKSSGELNYKSLGQVRKIQEICYAEIGRRMVKVKQKDILRDFRKSNIYIRGYLMKGILDYLQQFVKCCPDSIFILPNPDKAINFDAEQRPPQLQPYLQATQYAEIIRNVNYIIQKNIYHQKYCIPKPGYPFLLPLFLFLLITVLLIITILSHNSNHSLSEVLMIITGLVMSVSFILILGFVMNSYHETVEIVPITKSVCDEVKHYFNFLNGKNPHELEWCIGQSFFWIQIKICNRKLNKICQSKLQRNESKKEDYRNIRRLSYIGANLIQIRKQN